MISYSGIDASGDSRFGVDASVKTSDDRERFIEAKHRAGWTSLAVYVGEVRVGSVERIDGRRVWWAS